MTTLAIILMLFAEEKPDIEFLLTPIGLAAFGSLLFKIFLWKLADEVYFDGETILVRNKKIEERIALDQISNIHYSSYSIPIVEIFLKEKTELGDEIAFTPPFGGMLSSTKHPLIQDLIDKFKNGDNKPD